jgi:hypothetical protein
LMGGLLEEDPVIAPRDLLLRVATGFLFACLLSTFFLAVSYPGNLSPDSIDSWSDAISGEFQAVKPPLITLLQHAFYIYCPNLNTAVATFSLIQGTLFWGSLFLFIAVSVPTLKRCLLGWLVSAFVFPLWPYTVVHWTDVWVAIFGVCGLAFLELHFQSGFRKFSYLLAATLMFFLAVSARYNAASIIPLLALPYFRFLRPRFSVAVSCMISAGALAVVLLGPRLFLTLPQVTSVPNMLPSVLINGYLGTIYYSDRRDDLIASEAPIFDDNLGKGQLENALRFYKPWEDYALLEEGVIDFDNLSQNGSFLPTAMLRVVMASPEGYGRHKIRELFALLDTSSISRPYDLGIGTNDLGLEQRPFIPGAEELIHGALTTASDTAVYKHWFMICFGILAIIVTRGSYPILLPVLFGLLYAVPYVVLDVASEWRYLMPTYLTNYLGIMLLFLSPMWDGTKARLAVLAGGTGAAVARMLVE